MTVPTEVCSKANFLLSKCEICSRVLHDKRSKRKIPQCEKFCRVTGFRIKTVFDLLNRPKS